MCQCTRKRLVSELLKQLKQYIKKDTTLEDKGKQINIIDSLLNDN